MKKILTITPAVLVGFMANAQSYDHDMVMRYNMDIFELCAAIFTVGLFMFFIIVVMKRIFEQRLKNKIVDKGISETVAHSILETRSSDENKNASIKWFSILAGLGIGLMGVNYTQPLGFHSLAIMAFSISLSFLGYYFFTRNREK
jgi:drug/metabolite transporter (DMT)-like permease